MRHKGDFMSLSATIATAGNAITQIGDNLNVSAHNIANINTPNFQSVDYYAPSFDADGMVYYGGFLYDNAELYPTIGALEQELSPYQDEIAALARNDVNLATEYLRFIQNENALEANAKVLTTADSMNGYLMDMTI